MTLAPLPDPASTAIILAGAGTHGAFEAGAIDVLLRSGHRFGTVVGASSGALNGALLASAVRAGREDLLCQELPRRWLEHTGFFDIFTPSLSGIVGLRGFSGEDKVLSELESVAGGWLPGAGKPVRLVVVTAALQGRMTEVAGRPATSYEYPITFASADFDTKESRAPIYRAAVASGAIPIVFIPVDLPGAGPCSDGGLVNNTPIKHALADPKVSRIVVVVPYPSPVDPPPPRKGLELVSHAFDIFIQERLLRDLRDAVETNRQLATIDALAGALSIEQLTGLKNKLGLSRKRPVEIVMVRPPQSLAGNELSGFGNQKAVEVLVESGKKAAQDALALEPITV